MSTEKETVTIPKEEYKELLEDSIFLNCLRNAGVDNWDWYDEALSEFNKIQESDNNEQDN